MSREYQPICFLTKLQSPMMLQKPKNQIMKQVKWLASLKGSMLRRSRRSRDSWRSTCNSIPRSRGSTVLPVVAVPPLHRVKELPSSTTLTLLVVPPTMCNVKQGNARSCVPEGQGCLGRSWGALSPRNKNVPDCSNVPHVRIYGQPVLITRRLMEQIELHYRQTVYPKTHKCKQKRNTFIKIFQHETQACIPSDSIQNHSNISLQA